MGRTVVFFLWLIALTSGCSNLDFGRSPIGFISDKTDSGKPFVEDDSLERDASRLERLEQALAEWEKKSEVSDADYAVGPYDVLTIGVLSLENPGEWVHLDQEVDAGGWIRLPLIGHHTVVPLSTREIESQVCDAYRGKFIRDPQVTVSIKEYRSAPVLVTGAVRSPGVYYLKRRESSVLEVLFEAGGLSGDAGPTLFIVRNESDVGGGADTNEAVVAGETDVDAALWPGDPDQLNRAASLPSAPTPELAPESDAVDSRHAEMARSMVENGLQAMPALSGRKVIPVDLGLLIDEGNVMLNLPVRRGDVISVPAEKRNTIYILGYVRAPGPRALTMGEEVTALNALAMAGGLSTSARAENSYLIRDDPSGKRIIDIDLAKIARGVRPDVKMEPGDTLVVGSGMLMKLLEIFRVGGNMTYSPTVP